MEHFVVALIVGVLVILSWRQRSARSQALIHRWAEGNCYALLSSEARPFGQGPFFPVTNRQTVYYVTVQDRHGATRRGWVRCGSWWSGLFSDQVDVIWDD